MRVTKRQPHGILTAVITPFDSEERVDYRVWKQIVEHQIAAGVHGLFFAGGQGEFFALTSTERHQIAEQCVSMVAGRIPVFMGTGAVTTRESINLTMAAAEAGVDYAVVISPYYLRPSQSELAEHYLTLCRESPIPVLAYNVPERTGVELEPETLRYVAERSDRLIGLKDSSGNLKKLRRYVELAQELGRPFYIFMGRDHMILPALSLGCAGAVTACANVIPELMVSLYEAYQRGDTAQAKDLQERIKPLRAAFSIGTFPIVIKEAMEIAGLPGGLCRRPVGPLTDNERKQLLRVVEKLVPLSLPDPA